MGLTKYGIVLGAGYVLGRPEARQYVVQLRAKAVTLARHPKVAELRERAWDVAGDQALNLRSALRRRSSTTADTDQPSTATRADQSTTDEPGTTAGSDQPSSDQPSTAADTDQASTDRPSAGAGGPDGVPGSVTGGKAVTGDGASTGLAGTTVAEDSRAAVMDLPGPPPRSSAPPPTAPAEGS
jgi:hypothetical protein